MKFLLDVNVLIALIDTTHINHDAAHHWFDSVGSIGWASCPLTQNGVLRIVGAAGYPNTPGSPAALLPNLAALCALPGHAFWPDDISLVDETRFVCSRLLISAQLTDCYLLALAVRHGGMLATFDRRIAVDAVFGGGAALHVIAPRDPPHPQ